MTERKESYTCEDCGRSFEQERSLWGHHASCDGSGWHREENLRELYLEKGLSQSEIAEKYDTARSAVHRWLDKRGIETRSISEARGGSTEYQDREKLEQLYHGEGLSTREIARKFDANSSTITYWMDKLGIERRKIGYGGRPSEERLSEEELERRYWGENESMEGIADDCNVSPATVNNWLEYHGIEKRTRAESLALYVPDEGELRDMHHEDGLKLFEIAEVFGVDSGTVSGWFNRRNIPVRTYTGEEAARWNGGHERYYGPNWPEQRRKRLEADDFECVVCGLTNEEHKEIRGNELHVHHVTPLRRFRNDDDVNYERANRLENLVTLCETCHNRWEGIPVKPQ